MINSVNLQFKMSTTDVIYQGIRRNTLSLEFMLFWHLNPIENNMIDPPRESLNKCFHAYGSCQFTRWNWQNSKKRNVLIGASSDGCLEIVQFLIANPSILDFYETNSLKFHWALAYASQQGHLNIVQFLIQNGSNNYLHGALIYASQYGQLHVLQFLINAGAVNLDYGLFYASQYGHLNVVKFLINAGATDFNLALRSAQERNHQEIVKYLLPLINTSRS